MGTTQRALSAGIPICIIPWGRDQNETARRVEVSGAGKMIPRKKLSSDRLKNAVKQALDKKNEAEKIAESFKKAGGAKRAVGQIRKLLER